MEDWTPLRRPSARPSDEEEEPMLEGHTLNAAYDEVDNLNGADSDAQHPTSEKEKSLALAEKEGHEMALDVDEEGELPDANGKKRVADAGQTMPKDVAKRPKHDAPLNGGDGTAAAVDDDEDDWLALRVPRRKKTPPPSCPCVSFKPCRTQLGVLRCTECGLARRDKYTDSEYRRVRGSAVRAHQAMRVVANLTTRSERNVLDSLVGAGVGGSIRMTLELVLLEAVLPPSGNGADDELWKKLHGAFAAAPSVVALRVDVKPTRNVDRNLLTLVVAPCSAAVEEARAAYAASNRAPMAQREPYLRLRVLPDDNNLARVVKELRRDLVGFQLECEPVLNFVKPYKHNSG